MTGIERIAAERKRQVEEEGWTAELDDEHWFGELSQAASCYARYALALTTEDYDSVVGRTYEEWPWSPEWWKPSDDPIRNLEKAGALYAAEIDRLLREES